MRMNNIMSRIRTVGPINYFLGIVVKKAESQRLQQEHVDLARAAVLLKGYTWFQNNSSVIDNKRVYQEPDPSEIEKFFVEVDQMPPKKVMALVQKSVETQVINMFRKMQEREDAEEKEGDKAKSLTETVGFEVECRESTIYRAGEVRCISGDKY